MRKARLVAFAWSLMGFAWIAQAPAQDLGGLRSEAPEKRVAALEKLATGEPVREVVEAVAFAIADPSREVRDAAVRTLLVLRTDLQPLREQLEKIVVRGQREELWNSAVGLGVRVRRPDVRAIAGGLSSDSAKDRARAVERLCALGERADSYLPDVLALLDDPSPEVRAAVAKNVARIGFDEQVKAGVIRATKDREALVRRAAAEGLSRHSASVDVVAALRTLVLDPDGDVRRHAVRGLGLSGDAGAAAAHDIVVSLRDREPKVRVAALLAVRWQKLRTARAIEFTLKSLRDGDRKVLLAALQTTASMEEVANAGFARVVELTQHEQVDIRRRALGTAWRIAAEPERAALALRTVEAMLDEHKDVSGHARDLLEQFVDG